MATQNQIEANQQNALASTGPKTMEGKSKVAGNALKHGIFSKGLISSDFNEEEAKAYQDLLLGLKQDLEPQNHMELLIVEKIATNYWRLRKLMQYEDAQGQAVLEDLREKDLESITEYQLHKNNCRKELYYFEYGDKITPERMEKQRREVERLENEDLPLSKNEEALEYLFYNKVAPETEEGKLPPDWREQALSYLKPLSPQIHGKLRKEILAYERASN